MKFKKRDEDMPPVEKVDFKKGHEFTGSIIADHGTHVDLKCTDGFIYINVPKSCFDLKKIEE